MRTTRIAWIPTLFIYLLLGLPNEALPQRNAAEEDAILAKLKAVAPTAVEDFKSATAAMDDDNFVEGVRLYRLVYEKAPKFDPVLRRLGTCLILSGQSVEGFKLLEQAVAITRSPENLYSLAQFLVRPSDKKQATTADKRRALLLAREALASAVDPDLAYPVLVAGIAAELNSADDFEAAVKFLSAKFPDEMWTHYYKAIYADWKQDYLTAEREIRLAQDRGLPPEVAEELLASGVRTHANLWRYTYYSLYLLAAWAAGLVLLFVLGKTFSAVTLRWLGESDPNAIGGADQVPLRHYYRTLINIAGAYYYVSIPFVVVLVIAVAGSALYAFFMYGRIPIKLTVVLIIAALVTIYKMIASMFVKVTEEEPGRSLREDEAPGLFSVAGEVARSVGTRQIDEVRITPGTDMAVYERGSFRERAQDKAHRVLVLGVATLNGFRLNAFRAVLAHEYGHFSHRDTAGGDVAIRVQRDMMKFAHALAAGGQAVWWNIAFQFLRVYHFIFRRISSGATRLQEVLADRVAARNYGASAFEEGLRHVIRRDLEFEDVAYWEVNEVSKTQRAMQNLYELKPLSEQRIEEKVHEALNRPTSEDDTHPGPVERFRLAARVTSANLQDDSRMVWDLFANREALTREMSERIDALVRASA